MKNNKVIHKVLFIVAICLIFVLISVSTLYVTVPHILRGIGNLVTQPEKQFVEELDGIAPESEDLPYIMSFGVLYKGGTELISISSVCEEQSKELLEVLYVSNEQVYYLCTELNKVEVEHWFIESFDLKTQAIRVHATIKKPCKNSCRDSDPKNRNRYYQNGKIVLHNDLTVWEYNIASETIKEYDYNEYPTFECNICGEYIGDETIKLYTNHGEKTFSFDEMCQKSEGISKIYSFKDQPKNSNTDTWDRFFYATELVQCVNGKIYINGVCYDKSGGEYSIFLEYDEIQDDWKYLSYIYTWGKGECYIVPSN